MRGIHAQDLAADRQRRISPAHAGNTDIRDPLNLPDQDQPRTCGEYLTSASLMSCAGGSAPHMRGIQQFGLAFRAG